MPPITFRSIGDLRSGWGAAQRPVDGPACRAPWHPWTGRCDACRGPSLLRCRVHAQHDQRDVPHRLNLLAWRFHDHAIAARSTRGDSVDNDHACPRPLSVRCVIGSLWLLGHLPVHLPDLGLEPADVHARRRRLPPITCLYNERRPPGSGLLMAYRTVTAASFGLAGYLRTQYSQRSLSSPLMCETA
jgi:hypothetical protein